MKYVEIILEGIILMSAYNSSSYMSLWKNEHSNTVCN